MAKTEPDTGAEVTATLRTIVGPEFTDPKSLAEHEREQIRLALCSTRGRYLADRTSQLSGVPKSTVYYWAREGLLVPDHAALHPMYWSYRDLVLLRLYAWLRAKTMSPPNASRMVTSVRQRLNVGNLSAGHIRSDGSVFLHGDSEVDALSGQQLFAHLVPWVAHFDLFMPIDNARWQGPNLLRPSDHTAISPWVLSGDPCVEGTRVPTASLFSLSEERGLNSEDIVQLYPFLGPAAVRDAVGLERRLHRLPLAA